MSEYIQIGPDGKRRTVKYNISKSKVLKMLRDRHKPRKGAKRKVVLLYGQGRG